MSRVINKQRLYSVPKEKLDLLLIKMSYRDSNRLLHTEAEFIFENGEKYDVVVNFYGSYPYVENELENFVEQLNQPKDRP